jgi:hypothetical protein
LEQLGDFHRRQRFSIEQFERFDPYGMSHRLGETKFDLLRGVQNRSDLVYHSPPLRRQSP